MWWGRQRGLQGFYRENCSPERKVLLWGSFGKREARKGLSQFESEGKPGQEPRMRPGMRGL